MIYVRRPRDDELQELKRMMRQEVGRVSQRAHMVLLSADHHPVPAIAAFFACSRATVRSWLRRFDSLGPAGLYDEPRSGRPRKVDARVKETVSGLLHTDPRQEGYLATFWTVAMLALAVAKSLAVELSASSIRSLLHNLELRWGRPRLGMPTKVDPEKASKQWAIARAVVEARPGTAILYADESRIQLLPLVRAMWHWVGHQVRVPTPGNNETRAVFGALDIRSGRWVYMVRDHMLKEDFIAFLEHLLASYPSGPIILIVDNFSSHTAGLVKDWLTEHSRLRLFYLPKYCSHLNPVEPIWARLKAKVAANRLYGSMGSLLEVVHEFFYDMTPEAALTWAAA
jgi:transposase